VRLLKRAHAAQEAFSRQLIESQENERKRIAAELHDSLGQSLSIIRNRVAICLRDPRDTDRVSGQLEEIAGTTAAAIDEVREIAHNLRPFELGRLGLSEALRSMARRVTDSSGIHVVASVDLEGATLSQEKETGVYRVVQEALNNVVRHAAASEARVTITVAGSELVVVIEDDGLGLATNAGARDRPNGGGGGLANMAHRASMLGGTFDIRSAPGQGTTITVTVPADEAVATRTARP